MEKCKFLVLPIMQIMAIFKRGFMKHNFTLVFEFRGNVPNLIMNIDFYGSRLQADRAFYALSYTLVNSECETLHLFCGEIEVATTKFNSNNATIIFKKG